MLQCGEGADGAGVRRGRWVWECAGVREGRATGGSATAVGGGGGQQRPGGGEEAHPPFPLSSSCTTHGVAMQHDSVGHSRVEQRHPVIHLLLGHLDCRRRVLPSLLRHARCRRCCCRRRGAACHYLGGCRLVVEATAAVGLRQGASTGRLVDARARKAATLACCRPAAAAACHPWRGCEHALRIAASPCCCVLQRGSARLNQAARGAACGCAHLVSGGRQRCCR